MIEYTGRILNFNLPAQLTSMIGRDIERKVACVMLTKPEVRLLTVTGPGGIGKTHLSLAVAADLREVFYDGVCFVPLAGINNSDQVLSALVRALGMKEREDLSLLAAIKDFLQNKHLLLLLDNFEQVIDAAPLLLEIVQRCPDVTMLITSRILLHITGEHVFPLTPLSLPDLEDQSRILTDYSSVALLVERAQVVCPDFVLNETNAPVIVEICKRLEGLPLALELAAARLKLLTPEDLLARLSNRLDMLHNTDRNAPQRQLTIRATIQWSYDLLNEAEKQLLQRLAVFVGGCALTDIEAVYSILGDDPFTVLDDLTSLLDKSLIYKFADMTDKTHFQMLETIREFVWQILEKDQALIAVRQAHTSYFSSLLPDPEPANLGLATMQTLIFLQQEFENLRAALRFLEEQGAIEAMMKLAVAMGGIWFHPGYESDGQLELLRLLELNYKSNSAPISAQIKVSALYIAARIAVQKYDFSQALDLFAESDLLAQTLVDKRYHCINLTTMAFAESNLGEYDAADMHYAEGIQMMRQADDKNSLSRLLVSYGMSCLYRGQFATAQSIFDEVLTICDEFQSGWVKAVSLFCLGWIVYHQRDFTVAYRLEKQSVEIFRQSQFPPFGLDAMCVLASVLAALGDAQQAEILFTEAQDLGRKFHQSHGIAHAHLGLGRLDMQKSNITEARRHFEAGLEALKELKQPPVRCLLVQASCLENLAEIACIRGEYIQASELLHAADITRHHGNYYIPLEQDQEKIKNLIQQIKNVSEETDLPEGLLDWEHTAVPRVTDQFHTHRSAETLGQSHQPHVRVSIKNEIPTEKLTKRETDVLHYLAEGLTNAEIAEKLLISAVTVNSYLRSVYSKLNVSSRIQAMKVALEQQLV